jgi:hypothetical protein
VTGLLPFSKKAFVQDFPFLHFVRDLSFTNCRQSKYQKHQTGQPWETPSKLFLSILANWSQMPTIVYYYRCVSLTDAVAVFSRHTHTLSLSLSLGLSAILLFSPFFPFVIKTLATILSLSIEIQILTHSLVLISKVSSMRKILIIIILICCSI